MKCLECGGTGKVVHPMMSMNGDEYTGEWEQHECEVCNGTGEIEQTNEEWFSGMYAEAKAEWLADHMKCSKCPQQNRCNGYHGGCVALMLEWLKEKHEC
ncbi:MAG: hypothetical protein IKN54_07610 [Lachnospiraceae bacterium]|nr:hypothetical protein [Lachnospiraceae bacterium]